ncbi:MAG: hypothetical protein ACRD1K_02395 [Acidimicrobiales bacterium]
MPGDRVRCPCSGGGARGTLVALPVRGRALDGDVLVIVPATAATAPEPPRG